VINHPKYFWFIKWKMNKRLGLIIFLVFFGILSCGTSLQAGFGIQPPYVKPSKAIFAGTRYEQKITLLRSSADADMQAV
jgi:hypothetical protein